MSGFKQATIQKIYQSWSTVYDWLTPLYLLGNENKLRRKAVQALELQSGQNVLDVGCGTGRNFPFILSKIGPSGKLVGLDYTPGMLDKAQHRIDQNGWGNVHLIEGDAAEMALDDQFDATLSTLALSVIPEYQKALQRMVAHTKRGGRIAIAGAKRSGRWQGRPFNGIAGLLGWGAAADLSRRPWDDFALEVDGFMYREWFLGFFYMAAGRVSPS